jgi:predicted LPLAT superfamily acyltransferase
MVVPDELTLKLDQLDLLAVQFADDLRTPVAAEQARTLSMIGSGLGSVSFIKAVRIE